MSALRHFGDLLWGLLRELSDESAYARHLRCRGCVHSGAEWKRFCDERHRVKYSQAKCC